MDVLYWGTYDTGKPRARILRQALTTVRIFVVYRPFQIFAWPGAVLVLLGLLPGVRFLLLYLDGRGQGHVQSLILASILVSVGGLLLLAGTITSVIAANRMLLEDVRIRLRRLETGAGASRRRPPDEGGVPDPTGPSR